MIELSDISKTFNAAKGAPFSALKNINLKIKSNVVIALKGPSGSGKTTLLGIIGCMIRPTSGNYFFKGRKISTMPERYASELRRNAFGFIFQRYHFIKGLTVLENTMVPAYPTGLKHRIIKERACALLGQSGLAPKIHIKIDRLSAGEQQRAAVARALINDPDIVVADEPTAHLDKNLAQAFMSEIVSDLKTRGKTVLIAGHDSRIFNSPLIDSVFEMRDGRILQAGCP